MLGVLLTLIISFKNTNHLIIMILWRKKCQRYFLQEPAITINRNKIESFCKKHHVVTLALFGSILTSDFGPKSDVDILVYFDIKYIPSLFDLVDMESELSAIVGRNVDLKTPKDLSPYFRDDVLSNARAIYG